MVAKIHEVRLPALAADWGRLQLLELEEWSTSDDGEACLHKCLYLVDSKVEGGKTLLRRKSVKVRR